MKNKFLYFVIILLTLVIGICSGVYLYDKFKPCNNNTNFTVDYSETNSLSSSVEKIFDATVLVENYQNGKLYASGTGFIYKNDKEKAYVMTNEHVIENSDSVKVIMADGEKIDCIVVGSDEYADIAVLSIEPIKVKKVAIMGDSSKINLGDTLFTVGSPLGLDYQGTVTKGILSGKNRTVSVALSNGEFVMEVLQTDAAINEGNSGGPLCNINGEVIGINSLKIVEGSAEGMGFAIPIELALSTANKLESGETIKRPMLGISLVDIDNYVLYQYDINISNSITEGTVLVEIQAGSIAEKAGLQTGDVITKVDDINVKNTAFFRYLLYKYNINDTVNITFNRNGIDNTTSVVLTDALEG